VHGRRRPARAVRLAARGGQPAAVAILAAVAGPVAFAAIPRLGRKGRAAATTASLMAASVALVHLRGGVTEAHFIFFVMSGVVSLYQDWVPYGIALVVVIVHHGVFGMMYPHAVYSHDAQGNPWVWAGIHAAFVLAVSIAHLAAWRLNEDQVLSDPLTGLANRTLLEEITHRLLARGGAVSLLFIDLDDFKDINDSLGHAAGDEMLLVLAERLHGCVRHGDVVARIGGDEFAVVVNGAPDVARAVGERALVALSVPVPLADGTVTVHASVGVAGSTDSGDRTAGALLRNADLAMYLAKAQGKNRLVVYADGMAEAARRRAGLAQDLAVAPDSGPRWPIWTAARRRATSSRGRSRPHGQGPPCRAGRSRFPPSRDRPRSRACRRPRSADVRRSGVVLALPGSCRTPRAR
jgi:diguanylate cyclase (GGDEF)-like protein